MFADWIQEIDVPMDVIAEAIRKPVFFLPMLQSPESVQSGRPQCLTGLRSPELQLARRITRILAARATYRIAQGNLDGAIDDKLTIHRLGRLFAQQGSHTIFLVGVSIKSLANGIPINGNPDHLLTEPQLRRLLEGLDALPPKVPLLSFYEFYEWERYSVLSFLQEIPYIQKTTVPKDRVTLMKKILVILLILTKSWFKTNRGAYATRS